jgi:hypothetical protein
MKQSSLLESGAAVSLPPVRLAQKNRLCLSASAGIKTVAALALLGASAAGYTQEAAVKTAPVKYVHVMRPSSLPQGAREFNSEFKRRALAQPQGQPVNTGSGIVYTCNPNVAVATCNYLNTTVAGWYNDTFTNANASIYIMYGTTGLGQSNGYENFITYSQYLSAVTANTNQSAIQVAALAALNTYDTPAYGSTNVEVTGALGTALGIPFLTGIATNGNSCNLGQSGCFNEIITITNDPGTPLYYDNLGGTEPGDAYDFYGVVSHETDEVLGTSSCIGTNNAGTALTDGCNAGNPSAVDLFRYSSPGNLVLDSSLDATPGQYFSYNGGTTNPAVGVGGTPKVYNTLANGDDYADYTSSSPDCGTDIAVQDAEGCPGEDTGLSILNDGGSEIIILNAVGFDTPAVQKTAAVISSPTGGSAFTARSVTFTWTAAVGATGYYLEIGSTGAGSNNIYNSEEKTVTTYTFPSMPTNGETIYVRLYTSFGATWLHSDYTYTAAGALISSPASGSAFTGKSVTFTWNQPAGATGYYLEIGTTAPWSNDIYNSEEKAATTTSYTFTHMPTNGETIYVRLYTVYGATWIPNDFTYTAAP